MERFAKNTPSSLFDRVLNTPRYTCETVSSYMEFTDQEKFRVPLYVMQGKIEDNRQKLPLRGVTKSDYYG